MKKQIKVSMTIAATMLAMSGIAHAAPAELNVYGASAQYTYWNAQAAHFASTQLGCTAGSAVNNSGKHGFVSATACTSTLVPVNSVTGTRDLDIRYSGIASAEGPLAASKQAPLDVSLITSTAGACNVANGERAMYASATTTVCKQVHVGTSDVAGESLTQSSSGQKLGAITTGGQFAVTMTGVDTSALNPNNTVIVPFGFFVNASVKATSCTAGLIGNYATTAAQCDTAPGKGDGVLGAAATITNISREEANLLFSGYVKNWTDLGGYFTSNPVTVCLRHAGSGTHAALDLTVLNSNWGSNIVGKEKTLSTLPKAPPYIYFNQGSGDEIKCVNGNSDANPTGALIGAIGYADADQAVNDQTTTTSQNVRQLKYNGYYPTRTAIRNGQYDFYTNAWLYTNNDATDANNIANDATNGLIAYAQKPANVPSTKANYWAAKTEMKFNRGSDISYPGKAVATSPQTP